MNASDLQAPSNFRRQAGAVNARLLHALDWCARRHEQKQSASLGHDLDDALDVYGAILWSSVPDDHGRQMLLDLAEMEGGKYEVKTDDGRRVLHCTRCGYDWTPRAATVEPKKCARCRSYQWNEPRAYYLKSKPTTRPTRTRRKTTDSSDALSSGIIEIIKSTGGKRK